MYTTQTEILPYLLAQNELLAQSTEAHSSICRVPTSLGRCSVSAMLSPR